MSDEHLAVPPRMHGSAQVGSASGPTCELPRAFKWKSTGPIIAPKSPVGRNFVSIKDPSVVWENGAYHVYASVFDQVSNSYSAVYLNFADWEKAGSAPQFHMANSPARNTVAPQQFYFAPKKKWVLVYQWGASYSTSDEPDKPQSWTRPAPLLTGGPEGALDYWVICDGAYCHLFFSADNGKLYQSKMPIANFPGTFQGYKTIMSDTRENLFEASNVYKLKNQNKYLLIVEAMHPRYFRSWTATSLDGPWSPLAATQQSPFAGSANVSFDGGKAWTNDISHGDMVRTNPDQTMTIDPCNMQFLYQGADPNVRASNYNLAPYRLGLLTADW